MTFATLEDFEARHGSVDDTEIVETLLEDASALIADEAEGSEAEWLEGIGSDGDNDVPAKIRAVCVAVAFRAYMNPTGLSEKGIGSSSFRYRGDEEDVLYLTDRERRIVRKAASRSRMTSVTLVTPYSGDDEEINDVLL